MASTRKSPTRSGAIRWQAIWRISKSDGKVHSKSDGKAQRSKNFATLKEAKAYAAKMAHDVEGRGVYDPGRHTVESFLRRWLATLTDRGEHSPTTLALYKYNIKLCCRSIGNITLEKLGAVDLDKRYAMLGRTRTPATVLGIHRTLHSAFEQARKWKLISENPARDASPPAARKSTVRAFTQDEVDQLLATAAANPVTYTIVVSLLVTGMRRSELLGLAFDAVDLDQGTLTIRRAVVSVDHKPLLRDTTKTESSQRTIQIPALLTNLLQTQKANVLAGALKWGGSYRRDPLFVFPQPDGAPLDPVGLTHRLRRLMHQAGITGRAPVHAWRHTSATLLVGSTDVKSISSRLGHSSPNITMALYIHPTEERDRAAGEHLASLIKR